MRDRPFTAACNRTGGRLVATCQQVADMRPHVCRVLLVGRGYLVQQTFKWCAVRAVRCSSHYSRSVQAATATGAWDALWGELCRWACLRPQGYCLSLLAAFASNSNRRLGCIVGRALQVTMLEATCLLLAAAWERVTDSLSNGGFCRETGVCMAGIRLRCSSLLGSREQQLAPQGEGQLAFSHTAVRCTSL
jgi:hypothetical protein